MLIFILRIVHILGRLQGSPLLGFYPSQLRFQAFSWVSGGFCKIVLIARIFYQILLQTHKSAQLVLASVIGFLKSVPKSHKIQLQLFNIPLSALTYSAPPPKPPADCLGASRLGSGALHLRARILLPKRLRTLSCTIGCYYCQKHSKSERACHNQWIYSFTVRVYQFGPARDQEMLKAYQQPFSCNFTVSDRIQVTQSINQSQSHI